MFLRLFLPLRSLAGRCRTFKLTANWLCCSAGNCVVQRSWLHCINMKQNMHKCPTDARHSSKWSNLFGMAPFRGRGSLARLCTDISKVGNECLPTRYSSTPILYLVYRAGNITRYRDISAAAAVFFSRLLFTQLFQLTKRLVIHELCSLPLPFQVPTNFQSREERRNEPICAGC